MSPTTHRAVVVEGSDTKVLVIKEKALPVLADNEVLIQVKAVTLNPTDYKHVWDYGILKEGDSLGCDFAGDIVEIGKKAEGGGFKVGDAVAGFTRGGAIDSANGSFQEHVKSNPKLVWHVPKDVLSYEDAAGMGGIALSTSYLALYSRLKLPKPWEPTSEPFPVLIWAGSTTVGMNAIRLAKLSGLKVATTASPKHHELLKGLGADVVFDYKDPEAPKKIKEWSEGKIHHALDPISLHGSTGLVAEAFGDKGGTIITTLPVDRGKEGALATRVEPIRIYVYTALEKENSDYTDISEWYVHLPDLAAKVKVMPLKRWPGGLDAIPEALAYLRAGKTSAEKISVSL